MGERVVAIWILVWSSFCLARRTRREGCHSRRGARGRYFPSRRSGVGSIPARAMGGQSCLRPIIQNTFCRDGYELLRAFADQAYDLRACFVVEALAGKNL